MKLILHFPCKLLNHINDTIKAEGFDNRQLVIDDLTIVRYCFDQKQNKMGLEVVPKFPDWPEDIGASDIDARIDAAMDAPIKRVADLTGWVESDEWGAGGSCLFAKTEILKGELAIHAAGEVWFSFETVDEILDKTSQPFPELT